MSKPERSLVDTLAIADRLERSGLPSAQAGAMATEIGELDEPKSES